MKLLLLFSLLVSPAIVVAQSRDVIYHGDLAPLNILPTFDRGYLLAYEAAAGFAIYSATGDLLCHWVVGTPAAKYSSVKNVAADIDGSTVAAVEYARDGLHLGGLVFLDPAGRQMQFLDTGEYLPTQVDFGPDHSVWTLGWSWPDGKLYATDYSVLRKYSRDGALLGEFLPRSTFDAEHDPVGPIVGGWQLRVTNNRIGAVFYASSVRKTGEQPRRAIQWVELDLKGNVLGRWDLPPKQIAAYTNEGTLYGRDPGGISVLDRASGTWRSVPAMSNGALLGAAGDELVYMVHGDTLRYAPPSPSLN
jgi:hypothetical protein